MNLWSWIQRDGLLHIESCAMIVVTAGLVLPWWCAGLVALLAGIGKEIWDTRHGVATWHDVICDVVGVVIGLIIIVL